MSVTQTTVIVPCYQEAARLDVPEFERFLGATPGVRLLFVDDGSRDGTFEVLKRIQSAFPAQVDVLRLEKNSGKAEAVRQGILRAVEQGATNVGYWDADLATPLDVIVDFERTLQQNPSIDIILGARVALLGRRIERKPSRHYLGRVFATVASLALNLVVFDTQCGAKLIRVNGITCALFERPFGSRWVFDVELLARYLSGGGKTEGLYEYPVPSWRDVAGSKVKPWDFFRAVGELGAIYRRYPLNQPFRALIVPLTSMFSRYVLVGMVGTVLHYLVLVSAVELFSVQAATAASVGAAAGAVANYFFNYHFTFTSRARHTRAFVKFALVASLGAALSWWGVRAGTELGMYYLTAQILCTLIFLILGFLVNKIWTFETAKIRSP